MGDELGSYDTAAIRDRIKCGEFKVVPKRSHSTVWNIFSRVVDQNATEINYVICRTCPSVFKFNGSTSNLVQHKCYLNSIEESPIESNESPNEVKRGNVNYWNTIVSEREDVQKYSGATAGPLDEQNGSSVVDSEPKEKLALLLTEWIVNSCRPLDILEDSGFKKVAEYLIKTGANFGNQLHAEELLPHTDILSKSINTHYDNLMKKLDFEMSKAMGNGYSLTCSTMPDRYMKKTYLCMTMHYIKDSILVNRLLSFSCLEELDCTGSFLEDKIEQILRRDLRDDKPIFVTVADSKLNESSLGLEVVSCISDLLNKTIEQAFSEVSELKEFLIKGKELTNDLQVSGARISLEHALINDVPSRWNSIYHMLNSIKTFWVDSCRGDSVELENIFCMKYHDFSAIVEILSHFVKCRNILEDEMLPTLHLVIPIIHRLRKLCSSSSSNLILAKMKLKLKELLDELSNQHIRKHHKMAMYLFPPTNQLLQCTQAEKEEIIEECKLLMKRYYLLESEHREEEVHIKQEDDDDLFSDFVILPKTKDKIILEIRRYSNLQVPLEGCNALRWWNINKENLPLLYRVSCSILGTPASSAASQEIFDKARNLLSDRNHNHEMTTKIIFINKN